MQGNLKFDLTEDRLRQLCEVAVAKAIGESFSQYGSSGPARERFDVLLRDAVTKCEPVICQAVGVAVASAVSTPEFYDTVLRSVIASSKDKFQGYFDAVLKAAAKRAADDVLVQMRVQEALQKAPLPSQGGDTGVR